MKKMLIFYGHYEGWFNIYNKTNLMEFLSDLIYDVKIFTDIPSLKSFLNGEGQQYKNYIMPSRIEHIHELNAAKINSLFKIDSGWLKRLNNKKLFIDYAIEYNLSKYIPRPYSKSSDRSENPLVIIKPDESCYSMGVYKKRLAELDDKEFENNVVQEYIKDPEEYAGYFVAYMGNITYSFAYLGNHGNTEFIKCDGGKHDNTPKKRVLLDNKIVNELQLFLKPTLYTGTCCFDFKIKDGNLKVFEINPRMGGSLNFPENKKDLTMIIRKLMESYDERNEYN